MKDDTLTSADELGLAVANFAREALRLLHESRIPPEQRPPEFDERLIDAAELAYLLGCSKKAVYRKVKEEIIPAIRVGGRLTRFRFSDVERALRNGGGAR